MTRRLILVLALALSGCHLSHPLTQAQVVTILTDADYGVGVGCGAGWLEPPICTTGRRVLRDARLAAEAVDSGWQAAAKAVLVNEEGLLPPDSKLRPYFDAVLSLL